VGAEWGLERRACGGDGAPCPCSSLVVGREGADRRSGIGRGRTGAEEGRWEEGDVVGPVGVVEHGP
jgi:hypothetical protein